MIADIKKRANHRASIIEGQFRALRQAIDDEVYCIDTLTQSLAIQKSLASLNKLILENHVRTHVVESMTSGDTQKQQTIIKELLSLYELNNIRGK